MTSATANFSLVGEGIRLASAPVGDLATDTEVTGGDGHYRARLSGDWELWGPCGGYIAAVLLRAAGAHTPLRRPATIACHFLGVAAFDDVDLEVTTLRATRRTESVRVSMRQGDAPVAEAIVWCVARRPRRSRDHRAR